MYPIARSPNVMVSRMNCGSVDWAANHFCVPSKLMRSVKPTNALTTSSLAHFTFSSRSASVIGRRATCGLSTGDIATSVSRDGIRESSHLHAPIHADHLPEPHRLPHVVARQRLARKHQVAHESAFDLALAFLGPIWTTVALRAALLVRRAMQQFPALVGEHRLTIRDDEGQEIVGVRIGPLDLAQLAREAAYDVDGLARGGGEVFQRIAAALEIGAGGHL